MKEIQSSPVKKSSISNGLVMLPKNADLLLVNKRADTMGDESSTDEENHTDEIDLTDDLHKLYKNHESNEFRSFSDIATITDKITHNVIHRNSSDSSVYSDLDGGSYSTINSDCKSGGANCDQFLNVDEVNEQTILIRLQNELKGAYKEIKLKDEEVNRLSQIRKNVETELEDLTASLFQEAHNMVREANQKQAAAEKALKESQMKVDVLTAEVAALKTLVLTSTPSRPNPHLHPHIDGNNSRDECAIFKKQHGRSPSHFNLKYGRENSPSIKEDVNHIVSEPIECKDCLQVDPILHKEFLEWHQHPTLDKTNVFIQRIYKEDINLCLNFKCIELSDKVRIAVENGTILIEAVGDLTKTMLPKKCALLDVPRICYYRMNIGQDDDCWYNISQICRNRIIAVCEFLNYLKYIERGLVKSLVDDIYWEIIRLRKDIMLARLGIKYL